MAIGKSICWKSGPDKVLTDSVLNHPPVPAHEGAHGMPEAAAEMRVLKKWN
jgi:hypothetical protein